MRVAGWVGDLAEILLPAGCAACRAWIPGGRAAPLVCGRCRSRLRAAPWPRCPRCHFPRGARRPPAEDCAECRPWSPALTRARAAYVLAPPATDLAHALKYEGWRELAEPMAVPLAALAHEVLAGEGLTAVGRAGAEPVVPNSEGAVVVPVPTTARRLRRRGYNQAALLAEGVAKRCGLACAAALVRTGDAGSQTSLAPTERRENVRRAFGPGPDAGRVRGAHVLLIDDVLTTGATASAAADALAGLGAASVTLIAYARAHVEGPQRRS